MRDVLKTNNAVLLSFAQSLLAEAGIEAITFDIHASIMDGSLGVVPRRLMVPDDEFARAERLLRDGMTRARESDEEQTTDDRFLGGRLIVRQPVGGFRAGLDAVMLAASIPAKAGDEILELGAGAGTVSLCVAARIDGLRVTGAEIDTGLVKIANGNATANGFGDRVVFVSVDVLDLPRDMRRDYNHVICNPPFHFADGEASPDEARARALSDEGHLADWLAMGLKRTASKGTFTCILRADRLGEALAALGEKGVSVFPLWPRAGEPAKRVIVQVRKGALSPLALLPGLVLHEAGGAYTETADAILRGETSLMI